MFAPASASKSLTRVCYPRLACLSVREITCALVQTSDELGLRFDGPLPPVDVRMRYFDSGLQSARRRKSASSGPPPRHRHRRRGPTYSGSPPGPIRGIMGQLRKVIYPQARDSYRVLLKDDGVEIEVGLIGVQQGSPGAEHWGRRSGGARHWQSETEFDLQSARLA